MKLTPAYLSSTITDASETRSIKLVGKDITTIDDISYCVNMQRLDLSENALKSAESLSGLRYCKALSWISVAKNRLVDISGLCFLVNLQVLNASGNELQKLPWDQLTSLSSLKALILNNNQLKAFPSTCVLPKSLDTLVLSHNQLEELPARMLRALPALTKLSISHNALRQIPNLSQCWALKEIRLAGNRIFTLSGIQDQLPLTIEIIDLGQNVIRDRRELDRLLVFRKLTALNIRGNATPEEDEEFLVRARRELPYLRVFNGRNLHGDKGGKSARPSREPATAPFRLKPERQNKNIKTVFELE